MVRGTITGAALALCLCVPVALAANPPVAAPAVTSGLSEHAYTLGKGDTLDAILTRAGVSPQDRANAIAAMKGRFDPHKLQIGDRIVVTLGGGKAGPALVALQLQLSKGADVALLARLKGGFEIVDPATAAATGATRSGTDVRMVAGAAGYDISASLKAAGLSLVAVQGVRAALGSVASALPADASLRVLVHDEIDAAGYRTPAPVSVAIAYGGREVNTYLFPMTNAATAYVDGNGCGVVQARLDPPLPEGKLTSPWGWRTNPVLKRAEFHKGIDLSAPAGTPVVATADGVVEFAARRGNYGLIVKVDHGANFATGYSHLKGFAPGIKAGTHVQRGQVIGYVGRTGLATGNHLYYEVYVNGAQVDPLGAAPLASTCLTGTDLVQFRRFTSPYLLAAHE